MMLTLFICKFANGRKIKDALIDIQKHVHVGHIRYQQRIFQQLPHQMVA